MSTRPDNVSDNELLKYSAAMFFSAEFFLLAAMGRFNPKALLNPVVAFWLLGALTLNVIGYKKGIRTRASFAAKFVGQLFLNVFGCLGLFILAGMIWGMKL